MNVLQVFFAFFFCKDYCSQTIDAEILKIYHVYVVPKDSKRTYAINIFIVAFLVSSVFV